MNPIQTFDFNETPVRTIDREGQPWFVAADVCRVLELTNPSEAISTLEEDERNTLSNAEGIQKGRGNPNLNIISESGLYALIFKSRKPQARAFRKWVTSEVLPALRTTGTYSIMDGIASVQHILQRAVIDVYEDRMPLPKANAIAALASQYLRSGVVTNLTNA